MKEKNIIKILLLLGFYHQITKTMEFEESNFKVTTVPSVKIVAQNSKKLSIPVLALAKMVASNNSLQVPDSARDLPLVTPRGSQMSFYKLNKEDLQLLEAVKREYMSHPEETADLHPSAAFGGKEDVFLKTRWNALYNSVKNNTGDLWIIKENVQNRILGYFFIFPLNDNVLMIHPLTTQRHKDIIVQPFFQTHLTNNYNSVMKLVSCMHAQNTKTLFHAVSNVLGFKRSDDAVVTDLQGRIEQLLPGYMNDQYVIVEKELKG